MIPLVAWLVFTNKIGSKLFYKSKRALARSFGINVTALYRGLDYLVAESIIEVSDKDIKILDESKLKKVFTCAPMEEKI
jgi:DNA-binding transcriptional regulator YhcF (GntR family)